MLLVVAAVAAASAATPEVANSTVTVAPNGSFFRRSLPVKAAVSGSAVSMIAIASSTARPQTQLPIAVLRKQTLSEYKTILSKLVAWKRWKMAYYYLYSTKYTAYVASMPAEVSPEMATLKIFLSKSAIFFDILANYEITGFIWCVLLSTWTAPPPTTYLDTVLHYQTIKTAYSFFTWQWFLIMKDYFALFSDACAPLAPPSALRRHYCISPPGACVVRWGAPTLPALNLPPHAPLAHARCHYPSASPRPCPPSFPHEPSAGTRKLIRSSSRL